ncbi:protein phyllopod [Topomyia yanbarensis]|uniref:protein phyllopod n=1 Tax=Topomyia yanbarensis TaxID=2498891 RepID=UPI00273C7DB4|nr:protein phyllopod [Topomyia yanbarensis]XP_058833151.1 protein phyllopod [Topomyia yanbarensis]XP_058833152.1 protein phyllopod [Topomyia yanbarensis]XP_058833153.1 protein phyllopod [Topomyia yanbarensis]
MSTTSASGDAGTAAGGDGGECGSTGGFQGLAKKTNVCLICGIYTNLSLNIFEPRNGPNIREVIYQKYNFRAERGDNEEKYICYSCNNWLINWYSLQHLSESRTYESTPSSSRSQSENRQKRSKNERSHSNSSPGSSRNKENLEQDDQVSSTVKTPEKENDSPKRKPKRPIRSILRESNQQQNQCSNSANLVKPFESHLIRMLENQGTSVIKENVPLIEGPRPNSSYQAKLSTATGNKPQVECSAVSNEIILSFNSALSEVVPSLQLLRNAEMDEAELTSSLEIREQFLKTHRMSRSLSISLIDSNPPNINSMQHEY